MIIKFGLDKIFYLIILIYVTYIVLLIINHQPNPIVNIYKSPIDAVYQNDLPPIDGSIPDTIPYREYQKRKDSIITIRAVKNGEGFLSGSYSNFPGWMSTAGGRACDTCSLKWLNRPLGFEDTAHSQYYIKLNGWTLLTKTSVFTETNYDAIRFWGNPDSVEFYVRGNQPYIRKVLKKKYRVKDGTDYYLADIPVKFRFSYEDKCLMIPVSETVKRVLDIIFLCFGIFLMVFILMLFVKFIVFVFDLSKGKAFTDKNLKSLKFISLSLLIYPIFLLFLNLVTRLIFSNYFTPDVVLSSDTYATPWKIILLGFVFYVLYLAFKTGKALKDEHDLTV
jgi:hypothetical protein